jgi:hypothetical protein
MGMSTYGYDGPHGKTPAVRRGDAQALEQLAEMPVASNYGRLKFSPAIPLDGV